MEDQKKVFKMIEYFEKLAVSQLHICVSQEPELGPLLETEVIPSMAKILEVDEHLREADKTIDQLGLPEEVLELDVSKAMPGEDKASPSINQEAVEMILNEPKGILMPKNDIWIGKDPAIPRLMFITGEETAILIGDAIDDRLREIFQKHSSPKGHLSVMVFNRNAFARRAARALRQAVQEMPKESKDEDQDNDEEEVMVSMSKIRWGCAGMWKDVGLNGENKEETQ
ncbi:hypothetical protein KR026_009132 [Drosophila bipectinata]|nr:hypothetical protein KR026_009132 [Drosophila bipectinata]